MKLWQILLTFICIIILSITTKTSEKYWSIYFTFLVGLIATSVIILSLVISELGKKYIGDSFVTFWKSIWISLFAAFMLLGVYSFFHLIFIDERMTLLDPLII